MTTFTKRASEIFAGYTAGGVPRQISNSDVVTWGAEVEGATSGIGVSALAYGAVDDNSTDSLAALEAAATASPGGIINLMGGVYYVDGDAADIPQNVQFINGMIRTNAEYIEYPSAPQNHPFGSQVQIIEDSDDLHFWPGGVGQMALSTDDVILRCHVEGDRHEVSIGSPIIATRSSDGVAALYRRTIYSNFLYEPRGLVGGMVNTARFGVAFLLQDSVAASSGMKFIYTDDRFDTITEVDITTNPALYFYPHGKIHRLASGNLYLFGVQASRYVMATVSTNNGATWSAPAVVKDWGATGQIAEVAAQFVVGKGWVFAVRDDDGSQADLYGFTATEDLTTTTAWIDSYIPNGLNPPALEQEWGSLFFVVQGRRGTAIGGFEDKLMYFRANAARVYDDGGRVNALLGYGVICAMQENSIGYVDSCRLASGRRLSVLIDGESPLGSSQKQKSRIIKLGGDPAPASTTAQLALSNEPVNHNFDFAHWTRGTSFTSITSSTKVADRWRASSNSGIDVTRVALEGSAYERAMYLCPWAPSYAMRIQGVIGGSGRTLKQRVYGPEAVRRLASKPVFFGLAAAGSWPYSSSCLRAVMDINTGTGGSGTVTPTSFNFYNQAMASGLTYLGVPGYTPSVDGLTLGPDCYMELGLLWNDTGLMDLYLFGLSITFGDRYFHPHPRDFATERALIDRHVERKEIPTGAQLIVGVRAATDDACAGTLSFAPKVTTPTITLGDSKTYADFRIDGTIGQELTNLVFSDIGESSATALAYKTGFFTAYNAHRIKASSAVPVIIDGE